MDQHEAHLEQGDALENNMSMEELLAGQDFGDYELPKKGETRKGTVASISAGQILVSIGTKSEGVITGKEYEGIPQDVLAKLQVGEEIDVFVIDPEDPSGNVILSYRNALEANSWKQAEDLKDSGEVFQSEIIKFNKGGLIVPVGTLMGFVPASQISLSRRANMSGETPEARWAKMVGEPISVRVIEVDRERRRLILSERAASTETREQVKERILDELKEGDIRTGKVTSLADFGAFVNINGADGLVHLSEISWDRINKPDEVLKVGQEVKVKIISIDREKKRIGLSIRALQNDPWAQQVAQFQVGQLVEGKVTKLAPFGAFARLEGEVEGLIHISEISEKRIEHPKEVLKVGDPLTLRVIKIDTDNHRIGLSLRRVDSPAYAELDWQTLSEDTKVVPAEEVKVEPAEEIKVKPAKPAKVANVEPAEVTIVVPAAEIKDESAEDKKE
jgi:small subunit ribosomal protein S1